MHLVKLQRLFLEEVSGVDSPAHGNPGWMVTKSADLNFNARIIEAVRKVQPGDLVVKRAGPRTGHSGTTRHPDGSGRFAPEAKRTVIDGVPWQHSGAVARIFGGNA